MKTIFNETTRTELINRIGFVNVESTSRWGKMNTFQMLKHCTCWDEWVLGTNNPPYKQSFLGLIFGKIALKSSVKDDTPMKKNMPAGPLKVIEKSGDVELQKQAWITRIRDYENFSNHKFIHDFFGKMTKDEIGIFVYKHADHHLRQFGC
ncbi:MAG TPA: DUF1569 domain-containing protein [Ohtaekwangia sp.]|nr:DUF1569 domain-containing protein [Ohtaekwangia sp.]